MKTLFVIALTVIALTAPIVAEDCYAGLTTDYEPSVTSYYGSSGEYLGSSWEY